MLYHSETDAREVPSVRLLKLSHQITEWTSLFCEIACLRTVFWWSVMLVSIVSLYEMVACPAGTGGTGGGEAVVGGGVDASGEGDAM